MNKKNPQEISIYAQQFLKTMRKKRHMSQQINQEQKQSAMIQEKQEKQQKQQKQQRQKMQIQMRSDSQIQAEQLFQNLDPNTPQIKPRQQIKLQKIKKKEVEVKQRIGIQLQSNQKPKSKEKTIIIQKEKKVVPVEKQIQQQQVQNKFIKTKSILMSGKQKKKITQKVQSQSEGQGLWQSDNQKQKSKPKVSSKSVSFYLPVSSEIQKKWKDPIENQKKGKFDNQEAKMITQAVGKFIVLNDISFQQFQKAMSAEQKSDKFNRKQKIFSLLSTVLPNRSAESCYKYVKRNFNSLNRKGSWSVEQVEQLKFLVQKYGRKWTIIGKYMKRTNDNVYDKFRALGEENMDQRSKDMWKLRQLIEFLKLIEKMTKTKFLDYKIDKELQSEQLHNLKEKQQITERKYNSKNFIFHNIQIVKPYINAKNFQKIKIEDIKWNEISAILKTKATLDCRTKFIQLLQIFFYSTPKQFDEDIINFLLESKVSSLSEVNWKNWKSKLGSIQQAKNRFMIMKKLIQGRSVRSFSDILQQMKLRLSKRKDQN